MERIDEDRVVERIDELDAQYDYISKLISQVIDRGIKLRAKVTQDAMRGHLVDQDTTNEPADVLLTRIHAERGADAALARKSRKPRTRKASAP